MPAISHSATKAGGGGPPSDPRYEQFKRDINKHFNEETRSKKRIHELEQKQETAKLTIVNKNNEIAQLQAQRDKNRSDLANPLESSRFPIETSQSE